MDRDLFLAAFEDGWKAGVDYMRGRMSALTDLDESEIWEEEGHRSPHAFGFRRQLIMQGEIDVYQDDPVAPARHFGEKAFEEMGGK